MPILMIYRIFFLSILIGGLPGTILMADPIVCTSLELAKFIQGGFTDKEISKFCIIETSSTQPDLREKYAILEGKNWQTQYFLTQQRKKKEEVFFTVSKESIKLTSSNPSVQYYDVTDLGDTLRFKRKQTPYKAIYTITLQMDQMTDVTLPIVQEYKKIKHFTWNAK